MWNKLAAQSHQLLVFLCLSLLLTSPWLTMAVSLPAQDWGVNRYHVYAGCLSLLIALVFLARLIQQDQWRQYFPWLIGDFSGIGADLQKLKQKQLPVSGGRGLFSVIEGLTLLSLLAVAVTGVAWLMVEQPSSAMAWRSWHQDCAWLFIGCLSLHGLAIASHLGAFFER